MTRRQVQPDIDLEWPAPVRPLVVAPVHPDCIPDELPDELAGDDA